MGMANHVGEKFGLLTIVRFWGRDKSGYYWNCQCDCGNAALKKKYRDLVVGKVTACGCTKTQRIIKQSLRHGETRRGHKSVEYTTYMDARRRCRNPKSTGYRWYGGRGIEFRFDSFEHFLETLGRKPSPSHSIDRINSNGHYEPGNVRWATPTEQANNLRSNHRITVSGKTLTLQQAKRVFGVGHSTIIRRLSRGWCAECSATLSTTRGLRCQHVKREVVVS
jgi:hypothetical protein